MAQSLAIAVRADLHRGLIDLAAPAGESGPVRDGCWSVGKGESDGEGKWTGGSVCVLLLVLGRCWRPEMAGRGKTGEGFGAEG